MRIALISIHGCPCAQPGGSDAGGMNVYVDQVADRLARLGNHVVVYAHSHLGIIDRENDRRYRLVHLEVAAGTAKKQQFAAILPEIAAEIQHHAATTEISQRNFDLVTSHYWLSGVVGCELARVWEVPHVTSFHTLASIKKRVRPEENEPEIRLLSEARVAQDAHAIVAWTEGEKEHIAHEFDVHADKIAIVPPGVDTERFQPSPNSSDTRARKRILYVGRLDALKGVDLLIEAFATVVERGLDVELQIVGGGSADEFRRVLGTISKLRLTNRVKLPGVLPQSELPEIYSNADCIVAPSFHETFGLAVLEAAACQTPAVAADVDGLRAIVINGETGYLIADRDAKIYADKIVELMGNDTLRLEMSKAARKHAETLSWDAAVSGLIVLYNRISKPLLSTAALR